MLLNDIDMFNSHLIKLLNIS